MPDAEDEVEYEAIARVRYEITCPACGDGIDEDHDPAGEQVECPNCEATIFVTVTM